MPPGPLGHCGDALDLLERFQTFSIVRIVSETA